MGDDRLIVVVIVIVVAAVLLAAVYSNTQGELQGDMQTEGAGSGLDNITVRQMIYEGVNAANESVCGEISGAGFEMPYMSLSDRNITMLDAGDYCWVRMSVRKRENYCGNVLDPEARVLCLKEIEIFGLGGGSA